MTKRTALTLEVFATLAAAFEDPFLDRASLTGYAELDEQAWESGRRALQREMAEDPEVAQRFVDKFKAVIAKLEGGADPKDLLSPPRPVRDMTAQAAQDSRVVLEDPPMGKEQHNDGVVEPRSATVRSIDTTGELGPIDLGAAVPFSGEAGPPPPAAASSVQSGETELVRLPDVGLPIPFRSGDVDVTAAPATPDPGSELPFHGDSSVPAPQAAPAPRHPDAGGTKFTNDVNLDSTLPFTALSAADMYADHMMESAPLTLAQFASVMVEIEKSPRNHREILTRYNITADTLAALDGELKALCAEDSDTAKAWKALQRKYAKWLAAQRPTEA